jgi:integrase
MHSPAYRPLSGHVLLVRRKRGDAFYVKYRDREGRQVKRRLGPVWREKGRPPAGYYTRRTAEAELRRVLTDAERGATSSRSTGATFGDAAEDWFRWGEHEKAWKPATRRDYRSALRVHLIGTEEEPGPWRHVPLERVTPKAIEQWRARALEAGLPRRTAVKLLAIMHGVLERARRVHGLAGNAAADVERLRERYRPEEFDFYSPEEVLALVRAADDEQDATAFLVAAFAGLRLGEVLALRVRDVDFEAESLRVMGSVDPIEGLGTTKSGRGRTVPMVPEVAQALARHLQRERFVGPDDFAFVGGAGRHLDGSALRRRYRESQARAKLRPLRFHDLRHTFGSLAINVGSTIEVQHWMGHADARTTARYLHYKRRSGEARRLAEAFRVAPAEQEVSA